MESAAHDKHFIPSHVSHFPERFIVEHATQDNYPELFLTKFFISVVSHVRAVPNDFIHPGFSFISIVVSIHLSQVIAFEAKSIVQDAQVGGQAIHLAKRLVVVASI